VLIGILTIIYYLTSDREVFKEFWTNAKAMKSSFVTLKQWWDFVKIQIKQLCQEYTHNATRDKNSSMSMLEEELMSPQKMPPTVYRAHKKEK